MSHFDLQSKVDYNDIFCIMNFVDPFCRITLSDLETFSSFTFIYLELKFLIIFDKAIDLKILEAD